MTEERLQRRLAAILVSDVVGYTRMMQADEAGTLSRIKALRSKIFQPITERCGGRTFKLTGDGALVESGSAYDAVQCAIDVQDELRLVNANLLENQRVTLRIGVSLGDVIVDGDDLYGNGVNVAARMETLANPGEICISQNVHEHISKSMDATFEDLGDQSIKGLDHPVRSYRLIPKSQHDGEVSDAKLREPLTLPDKPSIAVLPFQNMSNDPEQEFLADGMAEDIITALSRYRSLFVIARNSTFAYKGQSPDLRDVSRELGVRYVLEGSIRKAGNRVRVTGQLIDGTNGSHIWAERYDRELNDIFELQDEITETIVAAIGPEIDQVERERAQRLPPDNLDAWESYQRGLWHLYRFTKKDNAEARRFFRQSAATSTTFSQPLSGITHSLYFAFMHGYADDRAATLEEAFLTGRQAVAADERDADAHFALGRILYLRRNLDSSIAEFEKAISLNPSLSHAHIGLATALLFDGRWKAAIESSDRAIRLSPHDPILWIFLVVKAVALQCSGDLDKAEEVSRLAVRLPVAEFSPLFGLASVLGQANKIQEAQEVMKDLLRLKPEATIRHMKEILPFRDPAHIGIITDGLRKAGMPE
jgi:adenylate cyclase